MSMHIGESPWDRLLRAKLWDDRVGDLLTPATRDGLRHVVQEVDEAGLHFYQRGQSRLLKRDKFTRLSVADTTAFLENHQGWFGAGSLYVSHNGTKQFPLRSILDLLSLEKIVISCATRGIPAPHLAAAITSLAAKGLRPVRFLSDSEVRDPLSPLQSSGTPIQLRARETDPSVECNLQEVLALEFMRGSGRDFGLQDPQLARALQRHESEFKFCGLGELGTIGAYLSVTAGHHAYVQVPDIPSFDAQRDTIVSNGALEAEVVRRRALYQPELKALVTNQTLESHQAGQILEMALHDSRGASAEETVAVLAALARNWSHPGNSSGWNVIHNVQKDYELIAQAPAGERMSAVQDLSVRQTLSAAAADALLVALHRDLRPQVGERFPQVRAGLMGCLVSHKDYLERPLDRTWLVEGAADDTLSDRLQLLSSLKELPHKDSTALGEKARAVVAAGVPGESAAQTIARFGELLLGLVPSHRKHAITVFAKLQEAIAQGHVEAGVAVEEFLHRYVLSGSTETALLSMGAPTPAPVTGVVQSQQEVVINGVRLARKQ